MTTLPIPYLTAITTYISYGFLFILGHVRDSLRTILERKPKKQSDYAPLCRDFEDFFTRRFYRRIEDCWNRPICSAPGAWIDVVERLSSDNNLTLRRTSHFNRCLNLGSYNYLGFGAPDPYCTPRVLSTLHNMATSTCDARDGAGTSILHKELEQRVANFVGKPAAMVFGMGFATNSLTLPALVSKGSLIISDALNHSSIVAGARGSGAKIKVFQHNSPESLEKVLRVAIAEGQPRTHRPWEKILIVVEGVYSMEGEVCCLPEIVALKKKYKAYLYLDEAHSIGACGPSGRGVCELTGVNPSDVDVLMGTFTKSFGSCGGYIAGSENLISYLKSVCPAHLYATSISPPAAQQILSAFDLLTGKDGSDRGLRKVAQLHQNASWFREQLQMLGLEILGDEGSPVIPIMLFNPAKIAAFSRLCLERNVAMVVVGFPATPLLLSRARVCISASHSRSDLEGALKVIAEVSSAIGIRYIPVAPMLHVTDGQRDEGPTACGQRAWSGAALMPTSKTSADMLSPFSDDRKETSVTMKGN